MARLVPIVAILLSSTVALAGPKTPELQGFWDAVYNVEAGVTDEPACQLDTAAAPDSCNAPGWTHKPACMKYFQWSTEGVLVCPGICANPTTVKIEHGVMKFDVEYVAPSQKASGVDHYDDRARVARHIEVPLSQGKVSMNQYANTKRYVEMDNTIPLSPAVVGWQHDGRRHVAISFDSVHFKGSIGDEQGRCEGGITSAGKGFAGLLELELVRVKHKPGDEGNLHCSVSIHGPKYVQGADCEGADTGGDSSGDSGGGGADHSAHRACKSQCKDSAYQCRKGCRSSASCVRQCGDNESSCSRGC